jgi:hypothetical protein
LDALPHDDGISGCGSLPLLTISGAPPTLAAVLVHWIQRLAAREALASGLAVIVPVFGDPVPSGCGQELIQALRLQARGQAGAPVKVLAVDPVARRLWCAESWQSLKITHLRSDSLGYRADNGAVKVNFWRRQK